MKSKTLRAIQKVQRAMARPSKKRSPVRAIQAIQALAMDWPLLDEAQKEFVFGGADISLLADLHARYITWATTEISLTAKGLAYARRARARDERAKEKAALVTKAKAQGVRL